MKRMSTNESETILQKGVNREEFNNWLLNKVSRQSTMISRAHGEKIIQYLRDLREHGPDDQEMKAKFGSSFRFQVKKRKFQLINVVGLGDILCLPIKDKLKASHPMLGQHRQVIFKEDMFDVIDNAHKSDDKDDRHRGYKGTFKKINATYCNIPREVVHKYVTMCQFCRKNHACFVPQKGRSDVSSKKIIGKSVQKKKEIEMTFLTRCQVDILDMQKLPDSNGRFQYIGHFLDHHTKYNVLFPLKNTDALYVARKLCHSVFNHFGLPTILHSNLGRKFVDELITWVLQFWSTDVQIINGNPRLKKINNIIQQRQKTIMLLIETIRAKQTTEQDKSWASWLPGIQYSLNTNQFEVESPPSYDVVFNRRPKVYNYASCGKEIPREEDILIEEVEQPSSEACLDEVISVDVSDLMQESANSMFVSQINSHTVSRLVEGEKDNIEVETSVLSPGMSPLTSLPYSLGNQYILSTTLDTNRYSTALSVDTNSPSLGVDTHALQISYRPALNLQDTNPLSVSSQSDQGRSDFETIVKPNMIESHDEGMKTMLQMTEESGLDLDNSDSLELSNEHSIELAKDENLKNEMVDYSMKQIQSDEMIDLEND